MGKRDKTHHYLTELALGNITELDFFHGNSFTSGPIEGAYRQGEIWQKDTE